jgi:hypothetical protein
MMRSRLAQSLQAANGFTLARLLFAAMRLSASPAFAVKGPDDLRSDRSQLFSQIADAHGVVAIGRKPAQLTSARVTSRKFDGFRVPNF